MTQTERNKSTHKTFKELSIQVSLNGLSFCILDTAHDKVLVLESFPFKEKAHPESLVAELKKLMEHDDIRESDFRAVRVVHENELNTFVPKPLFSESNLADYLKYHIKILENDYINYDELKELEMFNVFIPFTNVNNYIYDQFGSFEYKHAATVLIESLLKKRRKDEGEAMYVQVGEQQFNITVIRGNKLMLYNSFPYQAPADFIYYILFTFEQLELNPDTTTLHLMGEIDKNDERYRLAYKYIRNVVFSSEKWPYKMDRYIDPKLYRHNNLVLLNSF
ncbi:DUF3822 family protein [Robertkochia aurantiaca]|uniref:DUF3822 family protein n=1 Tax=Robertkochia aurantiaca TaxID=2873700 RepID=UPI001CCB4CC6|nr:DUF3822 family protein [Robertkochia sp. 3YJGBD-33]